MDDRPGAGWYPDPSDPARQRWWDGTQWTDQMSGADGASARPSSTADRGVELAERLRRPRPEGSVGAALSAVGGVLGVAGAFLLVSDTDGRTAANLVAVLVLLAGYALALTGPEWVRPAALPGALAAPLFLVANLAEELDGRAASIVPALLVGAAWLAMVLAPGFRGAPVLVAGVLLAGWVVMLGATAPTVSGGSFGGSDSFSTVTVDPFGTQAVDVPIEGSVSLVYAFAVIVTAAVLDRRGWHVLATPFIAVAVFCSLAGLSEITNGTGSAAGIGVFVVAVGAVIAVVGGSGRRRGSTWIGAGLCAAGLTVLVVDSVDDPAGGGVLMLLVAAGLVVASRPLEQAMTPVAADAGTPSQPEAF